MIGTESAAAGGILCAAARSVPSRAAAPSLPSSLSDARRIHQTSAAQGWTPPSRLELCLGGRLFNLKLIAGSLSYYLYVHGLLVIFLRTVLQNSSNVVR